MNTTTGFQLSNHLRKSLSSLPFTDFSTNVLSTISPSTTVSETTTSSTTFCQLANSTCDLYNLP